MGDYAFLGIQWIRKPAPTACVPPSKAWMAWSITYSISRVRAYRWSLTPHAQIREHLSFGLDLTKVSPETIMGLVSKKATLSRERNMNGTTSNQLSGLKITLAIGFATCQGMSVAAFARALQARQVSVGRW